MGCDDSLRRHLNYKTVMKYKKDIVNQKSILIYTPGLVYAPQLQVWPPHEYKNAEERPSRIDGVFTVLDSYPIIVSASPGDSDGLFIIDGHHRCAEACFQIIL